MNCYVLTLILRIENRNPDIRIVVYSYVLEARKIKHRHPRGRVAFSLKFMEGLDDASSWKVALAKFQAAIPTFKLAYLSDVETGQLVQYLKSLEVSKKSALLHFMLTNMSRRQTVLVANQLLLLVMKRMERFQQPRKSSSRNQVRESN